MTVGLPVSQGSAAPDFRCTITNAGPITITGTVSSTVGQGTAAGAGAPWSVELSDGATFYTAAKTGQFPSALVGGRLDINAGSWLGSTAPTVGQKTMANSIPVVLASDQSVLTVSISGTPSVSVSGTAATKEVRSATGTTSSVAGIASSVTLLASNANRLGATFYNDSTATLYVKCGATASTSDYTVKLFQDDYWEVPANYTGRVDGIWASATGACKVTEFT